MQWIAARRWNDVVGGGGLSSHCHNSVDNFGQAQIPKLINIRGKLRNKSLLCRYLLVFHTPQRTCPEWIRLFAI